MEKEAVTIQEEEILAKLRRGEAAGLEELMERYTPYVSAVAARILPGCPEEWEELAAETFLEAWKCRRTLCPGNLKGWLGAVVRNRAFNRLRARRETLPLEEGRLWFVADGQRLDVTDQMDEQTPYVHTLLDGEGNLHYWILGGTAEDYGWFEGVKLPDGSGGGGGILHSRTDLSQEELLAEPGWYQLGKEQVEELWRSQVRQDG